MILVLYHVLLAKEFLCNRRSFEVFDVSAKWQSAPGLDIEEMTLDNHRVIAEIKITIAYKEIDLGAQQKIMLFRDFEKLRKNEARYKYFFVTELKIFGIILNRYVDKLAGVTLVLLPQALSEQGNKFIYNYYEKKLEEETGIIGRNERIKKISSDNKNMSLADVIRIDIYKEILKLAKELGKGEVFVKLSGVNQLLKLSNRYSGICSAMEGKKIK